MTRAHHLRAWLTIVALASLAIWTARLVASNHANTWAVAILVVSLTMTATSALAWLRAVERAGRRSRPLYVDDILGARFASSAGWQLQVCEVPDGDTYILAESPAGVLFRWQHFDLARHEADLFARDACRVSDPDARAQVLAQAEFYQATAVRP